MKKVNSTKKRKKRKVEYIYIDDRTFTVKTAPSGNKYIQASFGNKADGTPLVKKLTAATRDELDQRIRDYIDELDGKNGANLTYYNACLEFIDTHSALSPTTINAYRVIMNNRFKCLHDKPIKKLTKQDFIEAVTEESKKGISQQTMKNALNFLKMICDNYEVLALTPKVKRDLSNYGAIATKENKGRKSLEDWDNAPTAVQVARWASENTEDTAVKTAISILLDLHSLRSEETRGLKYSEVFEDNGKCYINIVRTRTVMKSKDCIQECTKNNGSKRKILIDRRLYDMIHSLPHKSEDDFIIDVSVYVYSERIKRVIRSHTVNGHSLEWITPHKLRHIFKTEHIGNPVAIAVGGWAIEGGVSEKVYTHIKQKDMDELMSVYSKSLLDNYECIAEPNFKVSTAAENVG